MFQIFVDSAANLPAVIAKQYNIHVISFINLVSGKEITCYNPDLSPEEERQKGKKETLTKESSSDNSCQLLIPNACFRKILQNCYMNMSLLQ